jgi:hypothetical protein
MTKMHISEKLNNWLKWASDGQKAVITEARDEILQLQNRIETLQEVVREDHAFALELFKERERLRRIICNLLDDGDETDLAAALEALKGDE